MHETPKTQNPEPETHFWLRCDTGKPYTVVVSGHRLHGRPRTQKNFVTGRLSVCAQRGEAVAAVVQRGSETGGWGGGRVSRGVGLPFS